MAKYIPFANYLIRPAMEQGESMAGYICRYLGANGHRIQHKYYDLLNKTYCAGPDVALNAVKKIQAFVGEVSQFDNEYWSNRKFSYTGCLENWVSPNFNSVRICPQCLREHGFHFALWEFSLVYACPLHETALLEVCTACGAKFTWRQIAPIWHCLCGADMTAMQPMPAKSGCIALAKIFALAQDAIQEDGDKGIYKIYGLYQKLEWGCELAQKLSPTKNYARKYRSDQNNRVIVPLPTVAWVAKLLFRFPADLDKSVTRAIKRHFKLDGSLLESFCVDDVLTGAIEFLVKNPNEYLAKKLYGSLERCLNKYQYPLPLEFVVLFNPNLTDEKLKGCLKHFSTWWEKFSTIIAPLEASNHGLLYRRLDSNNYKIKVDTLIFEILKSLLNASWKKIDEKGLYALTDWWRIPEGLRKPEPPEQALYLIGVYLKSISHTELIIAHSLLMYGQDQLSDQATTKI